MQISLSERKVSLSVREFAEFKPGPSYTVYTRTGRWRAELGQSWHRQLQARAQDEYDEADFEVSITGAWLHRDWTVQLQGRIDQVVKEAGTVILREIKTINASLPSSDEELRADYRSYFNQLAAYHMLAELSPDYRNTTIRSELVFIDIADGVTQVVTMGSEAQDIFQAQLECLYSFIQHRWMAHGRLRRTQFRPPFKKFRDGQQQTRKSLENLNQSGSLLFEAPTGFGKTGIILEFAMNRLRDGRVDRVIYLTGKSTGQLQVIRQLTDMLEEGDGLNYFQLRNRAEHAIASPLHTCDEKGGCLRDIEERWAQAGIAPMLLYENGTIGLERIREMGRISGVCPFEISRAALPFAEFWICDYNYIFSPRSSGVLFNQPGFDPGRTLLLIDEAHNLPGRASDAWSCRYTLDDALAVLAELQFAGVPATLSAAFENWIRFLESLKQIDRLDLASEYELADTLNALSDKLLQSRLKSESFSSMAWEKLWSCLDIKNTLERPALENLLWSPADGCLNLTCLSAAPEIAATIARFGQTVLMSATLSPTDLFLTSCGLDGAPTEYLEAQTEWRKDAYRVAIDLRVDTRFRTRSRYFHETAQTIAVMRGFSEGPVAVFFPSYRYADSVSKQLEATHPGLLIAMQPRGINLGEQSHFIEDALDHSDILLLVLGSGFAESIDLLGGRVTHAVVVGPALPEVNAEQKARMEDRSHLSQAEAFRQVYQVPAIMKINQALGRLVRAPGQHANVLLHCRRFAEPAYQPLLAPDYRTTTPIKTEESLRHWLASGPSYSLNRLNGDRSLQLP